MSESGGEDDGSGGGPGCQGGIPEYVTQCYYRYGLIVASHPLKVIFLAVTSFLCLCTPLWYLPLPGYLPQEYVTSLHNYSVPSPAAEGGIQLSPSPTPTPLWYQGHPKAYIQQVIVRSGVIPWEENLSYSDSYRGPLSTVFGLARVIGNYKLPQNQSMSLGSECLLVEGVVASGTASPLLPHYNCLVLSPADLWTRNPQVFMADSNVLGTVHSLMSRHEGHINVADILFGVPSRAIGIKSKHQSKQVITYAVTLAFKHYSKEFISGLESELVTKFPLHQPTSIPASQDITHIYFPSRMSLWEYLIIIFYVCIFASIYFSILKMDMLKSKLAMAVCAQATLIASLCLAVGISAYFGLRPLHSRGKYVYPILAGLVGFENSMVLIRSILSTPVHLDVKIRVAQGLSREGWTITKYFLLMFTIVSVSFFLFIPLVQEICIYGGMVLLCDIYFQLFFLTPVLSMDLQHYEDSEQHRKQAFSSGGMYSSNPLLRYSNHTPITNISLMVNRGMTGDSTVSNLHRRHIVSNNSGEDRLATMKTKPTEDSMPRRLRVTYYFARKRIFQRFFMCVFIGWIAWLVTDPAVEYPWPKDLTSIILSLTNQSSNYNQSSNMVINIHQSSLHLPHNSSADSTKRFDRLVKEPDKTDHMDNVEMNASQQEESYSSQDINILKHRYRMSPKCLLHSHWPTMFSYYNISLRGHYLSILPPILLSIPVTPEDSRIVHHPQDVNNVPWPVQNPNDDEDFDNVLWNGENPFIPKSTGQLIISAVLLIPALLFCIYLLVAFYRCICSRNYAEWRSNWWGKKSIHDETAQIIGDAVPIVLSGHKHDVECLCTDGAFVISSCLAGIIRVWDPTTGECVSTINRPSHCAPKVVPPDVMDYFDLHHNSDNDEASPPNLYDPIHPNKTSVKYESKSSGLGLEENDSESDTEMSLDYQKCLWEQRSSTGSLSLNQNHQYNGYHPSLNSPKKYAIHPSKNGPPSRYMYHQVNSCSSSLPTFPNLESSIDFHFSARRMSPVDRNPTSPFQHIDQYYEEHRKKKEEELKQSLQLRERWRRKKGSSETFAEHNPLLSGSPSTSNRRNVLFHSMSFTEPFFQPNRRHSRNLSAGNIPIRSVPLNSSRPRTDELSPIWCLECQENLVFVGCGNGTIEIWDIETALLKYIHHDEGEVGITSMKFSGYKLIVARLTGTVDIFRLHPYLDPSNAINQNFLQHSAESGLNPQHTDRIRLVCIASTRAHQQPITVLTCDKDRILTGSQDHTLKVFNIQEGDVLYTLHGHCGPITAALLAPAFEDNNRTSEISIEFRGVGAVIASGAQNGSLCVWDLQTGACVYSVQAHNGSITALTCTSSYVVSLGSDEKLCVWERFQGHLLNTLQTSHMYCSSMEMLTNKLLITTRQSSLIVWDITSGEPIREVHLGDKDDSVFIRHLLPVAGTIVCDYSSQLKVVRIPVGEKLD